MISIEQINSVVEEYEAALEARTALRPVLEFRARELQQIENSVREAEIEYWHSQDESPESYEAQVRLAQQIESNGNHKVMQDEYSSAMLEFERADNRVTVIEAQLRLMSAYCIQGEAQYRADQAFHLDLVPDDFFDETDEGADL